MQRIFQKYIDQISNLSIEKAPRTDFRSSTCGYILFRKKLVEGGWWQLLCVTSRTQMCKTLRNTVHFKDFKWNIPKVTLKRSSSSSSISTHVHHQIMCLSHHSPLTMVWKPHTNQCVCSSTRVEVQRVYVSVPKIQ